jgi:MoaA/NifB/PqqE/SkfB family radical SAM enzyme
MDKIINTFTSTGAKIMHHPAVIRKLQMLYATPVSLQVAPTSKCNLNCVFCSNVNRGRDEDLDVDMLKDIILKLFYYGLKTVEWTGGGEPTLWHSIEEMIAWTASLTSCHKIKQGLITNGLELAKISKKNLDTFKWIRISMNCLDYVDAIEVPRIQGTLGFSYVMNEKSDSKVMLRLFDFVERHKPAYVRIVPNCQATDVEQEHNNRELSELVKLWGPPYFYQAKIFQKPDKCYWGYLKPFINFDGSVFRCSSVVLNPDSGCRFHEKYKWCNIEDLVSKYKEKIIPYNPTDCYHCVFKNQNDLIDSIINPNGHEDFI